MKHHKQSITDKHLIANLMQFHTVIRGDTEVIRGMGIKDLGSRGGINLMWLAININLTLNLGLVTVPVRYMYKYKGNLVPNLTLVSLSKCKKYLYNLSQTFSNFRRY